LEIGTPNVILTEGDLGLKSSLNRKRVVIADIQTPCYLFCA